MKGGNEIIERRKSPTWQEEIARLEGMFAEHYKADEEMHHLTNSLLTEIQADMKSIKEIVLAWNNMKGFATVMRFAGALVKWFGGVAAATVGLWLLLKGQK